MEKVVLITGSSKGIGKATAVKFAKIGGVQGSNKIMMLQRQQL